MGEHLVHVVGHHGGPISQTPRLERRGVCICATTSNSAQDAASLFHSLGDWRVVVRNARDNAGELA